MPVPINDLPKNLVPLEDLPPDLRAATQTTQPSGYGPMGEVAMRSLASPGSMGYEEGAQPSEPGQGLLGLSGLLVPHAGPAAYEGLSAVGRLFKRAPKPTQQQLIERAAEKAIQANVGIPGNVVERATSQAVPQAYQAAKAGPPVATQGISDAISNLLTQERSAANPSRLAGKLVKSNFEGIAGVPDIYQGGILEKLLNKVSAKPEIPAFELIREKQRLTDLARSLEESTRIPEGKQMAASLRDLVKQMGSEAGKVSPLLQKAETLAGKYGGTKELHTALTGGSAVKGINSLINESPEIIKRLGVSQEEINSLIQAASEIDKIKDPAKKISMLKKVLIGGGAIGTGGYFFHRYLYDRLFSGH